MTEGKRDLSTELTFSTPDGVQAKLQNLPVPVMQALYHQITGKREVLRDDFRGDFFVEKRSVQNLCERIDQTLDQFSHKAKNYTITILHHNKDKVTCSSLERFMQYDEGRSDPISSVIVDLSFLISVPTVGEFQSYNVQIELNSFLLLKSDRYGTVSQYRATNRLNGIQLKIEYIDYVVSKTFHTTIKDWVNSLSKIDIWKFPEDLQNNSYRINRILSSIGGASSIYMISNTDFALKVGSDVTPVLYIVLFFILVELFGVAFDKVEQFCFVDGDFCIINLNRGDKRNYDEFLKRRKRYNSIGAFIFITMLFSILVNIFSSYLFEWIK